MQIFQAPLWLLNGSLLDGASHPALHTIHRNIDLKKTQKSQKNIFSLILLVHSSFVSRGKKLGKVFTMSTLLLELLSQIWYYSLSVLASRARKIYHICMTFSGMLLLALKDSDLLVKETVPQGKKVPKNYFLLLKR